MDDQAKATINDLLKTISFQHPIVAAYKGLVEDYSSEDNFSLLMFTFAFLRFIDEYEELKLSAEAYENIKKISDSTRVELAELEMDKERLEKGQSPVDVPSVTV